MNKNQNKKPVYDLEQRTYFFAREIRIWIKTVPNNLANMEDSKQLIKSSGSIGANYIEANESLSKKDFLMRLKISRKEAKESLYWLRLISETNNFNDDNDIKKLIQEATELKKILSSIIEKSK